MNLIENIHRINTLIGEDKANDTIRIMIDKMGVVDALKMAAEPYLIYPYLTDNDKVNYVKHKVAELAGTIGEEGFNLEQINERPIYYFEDDDYDSQIEHLNKDDVYVRIYDNETGNHLRSDNVKYERLPTEVLDELFRILVDK